MMEWKKKSLANYLPASLDGGRIERNGKDPTQVVMSSLVVLCHGQLYQRRMMRAYWISWLDDFTDFPKLKNWAVGNSLLMSLSN